MYGLQKELIPKTGIIGIVCGVIGLILTLVYVIYNGVVYTNYYDDDNIYKVDGDGAFAELKDGNYKCFYYKESKGEEALIAKYSDLIKKQYLEECFLVKNFIICKLLMILKIMI